MPTGTEKITIFFDVDGDEKLIKAFNAIARAQGRVAGTTKNLTKQTQRNTKTNSKADKGFFKVGGTVSVVRSKLLVYGFAVGLVTKAVQALVGNLIEQEKAEKKLEVALGGVNTSLLNQASALQQLTTFGDEAIIGAQALIASFVDDEEQIKRATEATLDLAAAKGMDLNAAADLVSKTLGSSTNALSRYGITVEGAVGSSRRLESLTRNVAKLFGGQARAEAETLGGAVQQMGNAFGDASEALGKVFAPIIIRIAKFFKSAAESVGDFFTRMTETDLETTIRQLEELGVAPEKLKKLKEFKLKEDLKDINNEIGNMEIAFKSSAEAEEALTKIDLTSAVEVVNEELDKRTQKEQYLASLLRAKDMLEKGTAETKIKNGEEFVKLLDEEGNFLGKTQTMWLDATIAQEKLGIQYMENGVILNTSNKIAQGQVDKNKDLIDKITEQITILKDKEEIETKILELQGKQNDEAEKFTMETKTLLTGLDAISGAFDNVIGDFGGSWSTGFDKMKEVYDANYAEFQEESQAWAAVAMEGTSIVLENLMEQSLAASEAQMEIYRQQHQMQVDANKQAESEDLNRLKSSRIYQHMSAKQQKEAEDRIFKNTKALNDKLDKELAGQLASEFKKKQAMAIVGALIDTSSAIMQSLKNNGGWPAAAPFVAIAAAMGALQIAQIKSQKAPKMARGGLIGGALHSQGGTLINAERGEFVMRRNAVEAMGVEAMNRINQGGGGGSVNISFSGNVLSDDFITEEAVPKIKEALRRGGSIE